MKRSIEINFSHTKHEFLVRLYEDGKLYNWFIVSDSKEIQEIISRFYFS